LKRKECQADKPKGLNQIAVKSQHSTLLKDVQAQGEVGPLEPTVMCAKVPGDKTMSPGRTGLIHTARGTVTPTKGTKEGRYLEKGHDAEERVFPIWYI